ncbi:Urease subunit gamma [Dissostichus eleginoides]|uniref:Urease subunit gamma n=1 Tax=Dissostichus eleginoides TaxID=100907 RepID=A0AAD9FM70_DISEL|nr:Urease subunit gamma [Dissostichus eleginoides]
MYSPSATSTPFLLNRGLKSSHPSYKCYRASVLRASLSEGKSTCQFKPEASPKMNQRYPSCAEPGSRILSNLSVLVRDAPGNVSSV